jgi:urease subunit alpha
MFGSLGQSVAAGSITFVSQAALAAGIGERLGLARRLVAVKGVRTLSKADMVLNDATPRMQIDPETYEVLADGVLMTSEAAVSLPMAQRYFLF